MINFDTIIRNAPPLPEYKGTWASFYLEPMIASSERITVLVAAIGNDGQYKIHTAIRQHVLEAMFEANIENINNIIQITAKSLENHIKSFKTFAGWVPPLSGIKANDIQESLSTDITGLLRQSIMMTASLAALDFSNENDELIENTTSNATDRWNTSFKQSVIDKKPDLANYFDKSLTLKKGNRDTKIFYLSSKLIVNTERLIPAKQLTSTLIKNKAKFADLLEVKTTHNATDLFDLRDKMFSLITYHPNFDDPTYSENDIKKLIEAINQLKDLCDSNNINMVEVNSADSAASKLIELEAA